jgi:hypothetical protein
MTDEVRKLDLDELFGQAQAVKVVHNGREYELLKLDALGPRQAVKIQKMQKKAQVLQSLGEQITEEQSLEIEKIFEDIILMLCEDFPVKEITFAKKLRIVMYYMEETEGKKALENALGNLTGRTRSRK